MRVTYPNSPRRHIRTAWTLAAILALFLTAGCIAPSQVYHSPDAIEPPLDPSLVTLPPDVLISKFTAGGVAEPQADWSATVSESMKASLHSYLFSNGVRFAEYDGVLEDADVDTIRQLNVLLDAIELQHLKASGLGGDRDYKIGDAERKRLARFGTDYALLIVFKANRATAGRHVVATLSSVASLGFTIPETSTVTFRSALIDLRDGHIKWANFDDWARVDVGDPLNTSEKQWESAIEHLLREFPL